MARTHTLLFEMVLAAEKSVNNSEPGEPGEHQIWCITGLLRWNAASYQLNQLQKYLSKGKR